MTVAYCDCDHPFYLSTHVGLPERVPARQDKALKTYIASGNPLYIAYTHRRPPSD
jgi:hypothetical protein